MIKINKYNIIFLLSFTFLHSAYLRDVPVTLIQPDGSNLECFVTGDEFYNSFHDQDGYTIIQSDDDG